LRGAVARTGRPKRQSGLGGSERRENVKGSFAVLRPGFVRGRTLLVVDDVMTTGSTLSECARALKEAGAAKVFALTLARTVK
ncbi:MAG: ComF family protein, partial [Kiritimatiellae bacterium]|nr:ComF family protein [Kiritimatiellia bacterium]